MGPCPPDVACPNPRGGADRRAPSDWFKRSRDCDVGDPSFRTVFQTSHAQCTGTAAKISFTGTLSLSRILAFAFVLHLFAFIHI